MFYTSYRPAMTAAGTRDYPFVEKQQVLGQIIQVTHAGKLNVFFWKKKGSRKIFFTQLRKTRHKGLVFSQKVTKNFILTSKVDCPSLVAHFFHSFHSWKNIATRLSSPKNGPWRAEATPTWPIYLDLVDWLCLCRFGPPGSIRNDLHFLFTYLVLSEDFFQEKYVYFTTVVNYVKYM